MGDKRHQEQAWDALTHFVGKAGFIAPELQHDFTLDIVRAAVRHAQFLGIPDDDIASAVRQEIE